MNRRTHAPHVYELIYDKTRTLMGGYRFRLTPLVSPTRIHVVCLCSLGFRNISTAKATWLRFLLLDVTKLSTQSHSLRSFLFRVTSVQLRRVVSSFFLTVPPRTERKAGKTRVEPVNKLPPPQMCSVHHLKTALRCLQLSSASFRPFSC